MTGPVGSDDRSLVTDNDQITNPISGKLVPIDGLFPGHDLLDSGKNFNKVDKLRCGDKAISKKEGGKRSQGTVMNHIRIGNGKNNPGLPRTDFPI